MGEEHTGAGDVTVLAEANAPVFETLVQMTLDTFERSGLDQETYLPARIAALVAMDASAPSYLLNIGTAAEAGVPLEKIQGTLVAIAPVVGSARVVSAARAIGDAFELPAEKEQ
ncbi:carboxymuconolactone decarboxylase family protein [Streptomyces sp. NPDC001617]